MSKKPKTRLASFLRKIKEAGDSGMIVYWPDFEVFKTCEIEGWVEPVPSTSVFFRITPAGQRTLEEDERG